MDRKEDMIIDLSSNKDNICKFKYYLEFPFDL